MTGLCVFHENPSQMYPMWVYILQAQTFRRTAATYCPTPKWCPIRNFSTSISSLISTNLQTQKPFTLVHSPLVIIKTEAVMTIVVQTVFRPRGLILLLALCSLINLGHTKQQRQKGKFFFYHLWCEWQWLLLLSTEKYLLTFRNIMAQSFDSVLKSIIQNINKINLNTCCLC